MLSPSQLVLVSLASVQGSFVNWETPQVHPLELTSGGTRLLAVNTADDRVEVFDATGSSLVPLPAISVGTDPVSVRARTETEAWVVNHISDSVSIIDLPTGRVRATLSTDDEPCDVVFAGFPQRAFVSCSQANTVLVFNPLNLLEPPVRLEIEGEDPRALAVSPSGDTVYAAVFESGNGTTILGGDETFMGTYPPKVVNAGFGPYAGVNPPPNAGAAFDPPQNPSNPAPPAVSLIIRRDDSGNWLDDNGTDWSTYVDGPDAGLSGRLPGWTLLDHDLVKINTASLNVSYVPELMNLNMALAVRPTDGTITVVGTDATNEIRFEPLLTGTFVHVLGAHVDPNTSVPLIADLNGHLDYSTGTVAQVERDLSVGDPRAVIWSGDGSRAFVAGMGSNNLISIDDTGARVGLAPTIEVGQGPTGLALHESADRLYVLNMFDATVSVVDLTTELETAVVPFHDPTPDVIVQGRPHLYDTHRTSGLGQLSCAACHIDARLDRLSWDLGSPPGDMKSVAGQNHGANHPLLPSTPFVDFHPMKGPMLTQTLVDIVGKEPLHWRGDKNGLEEFNGAFTGLQGDDEMLTPQEMQEFEDFLATLHYPPNPFREFDNSLSPDVPLDGHYTTGRFAPAGQPLPDGDAARGLSLFLNPVTMDGDFACNTCHSLPTGLGTDHTWTGSMFEPLAPGVDGEHHHSLSNVNGTIKIPQLRGLHERSGFNTTRPTSTAGFGYVHDGSVDSVERFVSQNPFEVTSDQDVADLVGFLVSLSGSDLPDGNVGDMMAPPGTASQDSHAAVGKQVTLRSALTPAPGVLDQINAMISLADTGAVGLMAKSQQGDRERGYAYLGSDVWQSDRLLELDGTLALESRAEPGSEITFTVTTAGNEVRMGIDRDEDGHYDQDEVDSVSDAADPADVPGPCGDPLPTAASGLIATSPTRGQIDLVWTDNSAFERWYVVERSAAGAGAFATVTTLPADTTHFTDIGLECGAAHDYRISAVGCGGTALSSVASTTATSCDFLTVDVPAISVAVGGEQNMTLRAGSAFAGQLYVILGSTSGTTPGIPLGALHVPLNVDFYLVFTLQAANIVPLINTVNLLDAAGEGSARFQAPAGLLSSAVGLTLDHAFVVFDPSDLSPLFVSNAQSLDLDP